MKRLFIVGLVGAWTAAGLFVTACGGDDNIKPDGGGMDATVDDTGTGMDGTVGMDSGDMDTGMQGMDGSMGTDGGGTGPNPGKVNCGTMLDCDAGGNGCCVHFLADAGQTYQCVPMGQCGGNGLVRWYCDERADCMQGESCCVGSFQGETFKTCNNFCGNGTARACKSTADCPDAGACNTYTCPGNIVIQACTKPNNCN